MLMQVRRLGVVARSLSISTVPSVSRSVILQMLRPGASISIGKDAALRDTAICAAISVEIGAECLRGCDIPSDAVAADHAARVIGAWGNGESKWAT